MEETFEESLNQIVSEVGQFPPQAYHFIREGLSFAVRQIHGPESPPQQIVFGFLAKKKLDLEQLRELNDTGGLPKRVARAIQRSGGIDKFNRHVSGPELCWGLRDYALHRWGRLATLVLGTWNVTCTLDFGRLVFAMIEHDLMQKQPSDRLEDFDQVYDFNEAMNPNADINLNRRPRQ